MSRLSRGSILSKTKQVAGFTLASRVLGIIREFFQVRYFGTTGLADAFFTAYKIPNSLRKIFAEGALSAAFIPTIVQAMRSDGVAAVNHVMTLGFLCFESMVLLVCAAIMAHAEWVMGCIVPGFSPEQIAQSVTFLYILMPLIFFLSTTALLAGPMQAVNHFFVPSFGPVLLNIVYILGLLICLYGKLPVTVLCWIILLGGFVQCMMHLIAYIRLGFGFGSLNKAYIAPFLSILPKFFYCFLSMSVLEVGLFLDTSFASYLPKGSVALIYYANRFMGIPLGVFATAFAAILLPHLSHVGAYAPRRLGYYLFEATKLVWWVTMPVSIIMMLLSTKLFTTLFLSDKFSYADAHMAAAILSTFLCSLFFFAINKIILNVYYALHATKIPGLIAICSVGVNALFNWYLMGPFGAVGLAAATAIATLLQTMALFWALHMQFGLPLYCSAFAQFAVRALMQMGIVGSAGVGLYALGLYALTLVPQNIAWFMYESFGFWLWVVPLCILYMGLLYITRNLFGVRLLFLER